MGRQSVTEAVEGSDCVILLGAFMTDINLGIYTAKLDVGRCIYATSESCGSATTTSREVGLEEFLPRLTQADLGKKKKLKLPPKKPEPVAKTSPSDPVTIKSLFDHMNSILDDDMVVIADVGDSLFASSDLTIHKHTEFLSPAYYTSMGFAIPASVGVQVANRKLRPIVFVGDGAFQMTCMELSTAVRYDFNPIIVVLNNKGYTTERFILDGEFNNILNWNYHRMPDLLGAGVGLRGPHRRRPASVDEGGDGQPGRVHDPERPPRPVRHEPGAQAARRADGEERLTCSAGLLRASLRSPCFTFFRTMETRRAQSSRRKSGGENCRRGARKRAIVSHDDCCRFAVLLCPAADL